MRAKCPGVRSVSGRGVSFYRGRDVQEGEMSYFRVHKQYIKTNRPHGFKLL